MFTFQQLATYADETKESIALPMGPGLAAKEINKKIGNGLIQGLIRVRFDDPEYYNFYEGPGETCLTGCDRLILVSKFKTGIVAVFFIDEGNGMVPVEVLEPNDNFKGLTDDPERTAKYVKTLTKSEVHELLLKAVTEAKILDYVSPQPSTLNQALIVKAKRPYSLDKLLELNEDFHAKHELTQADVYLVNYIIKSYKEFNTDTLKPGDIIIKGKNKYVVENIFLEKGRFTAWPLPCSIFINNLSKIKIVSEGYPENLNLNQVAKLDNKNNLPVWTWGRKGLCNHGGIHFKIEVNKWRYFND